MVVKNDDLETVEFVIATGDVYGIEDYKTRLKRLFDVRLRWNIKDDGDQNFQWFYITEGSAEDRQLAKEYIKAVFEPETSQVITADYGCLNLADEIEEIERTSGAFISHLEEEQFEIRGSEMAATLAYSKLEEAIRVFQNNNKFVEKRFLETKGNFSNEVKTYGLKRTEVKEDLREVEELNTVNLNESADTKVDDPVWILRDPHSVKGKGRGDKTHGSAVRSTRSQCSEIDSADSKEPVLTQNTENKEEYEEQNGQDKVQDENSELGNLEGKLGALESQSRENGDAESEPITMRVRDFAAKLGYRESEISSAMAKLGPEADKNAILLELVNAQASMKQLEEGPSSATFKSAIPALVTDPSCLRPIVIDGSNVAMSHGNQRVFSCRGIGIAVDWFLQHGHREITVFVPQWRKEASKTNSPIIDQDVLTRLEQDRFLTWTPARTVRGRRITCYDDRFIVKLATENDGVIVSNDNFRDLENESSEWKKVIEQRLLMYTFVNDRFMPPDDPLGRHGPKLKEFLRKGMGQLCPYGRKCTYGKRCKYLHPERNSKTEAELTAGMVSSDQTVPPLPEVPYGDVRPVESSLHSYSKSHPIQSRPLPPLPEQQIPASILSKPLPLPPNVYHQTACNMSQLFPPTLRSNVQSNPAARQIKTMSDPTPSHECDPDIHERLMCHDFHRIMSMPSLDGTAMGPLPHLAGPPPQRGSQSHMVPTNSGFAAGMYPGSRHPDVLSRGMSLPPVPAHAGGSRPTSGEWRPEETYGACGGYQLYQAQPPPVPPRYHGNQPMSNQGSNYDMAGNHWGISYAQPSHGYPSPHYQYTQGNSAYYSRNYASRTPYHGQGNTFYRSRAPPIIGNLDYETTDNPKESESYSQDELRIKAYDKLCEIFPEDGEKILKVLDDHPEVTNIEQLTQHLLEEQDK